MRALVWFRSDLRIADNPALWHACRAASRGVIAAALLSPEQWRRHDWGGPKVTFILRNLRDLSGRLEKLGVPLIVLRADTFAKASKTLLALAREHGCDELFFNREYEINESHRDRAVRDAFEGAGRRVHAYTDQVILAPGEVVTQGGRAFSVFSPFRKAWLRTIAERGGIETLGRPRLQPRMVIPPTPRDRIPVSLDGFDASPALADEWPAGPAAASRRLTRFLERRLAGYADSRDRLAENGTSRLSPYLSSGAISARECLAAAVEAAGGRISTARPGPAAWITELIWRDFYKHVLVAYPRVSMGRAFKPETDRLAWNDDDRAFDAWSVGRTGIPVVDAAARQLLHTGWMHNRGRMITAMYLTKNLFIDWRRGERHFMRHLIDGDLSANNGGWQWAASTGTDAAPYFRMFNPTLQGRRFDPDGAYIRRWVPELADVPAPAIHEPWTLPPSTRRSLDYPTHPPDHAAARARVMAAFAALRSAMPANP